MSARLAPAVGESFGGYTIESVLGRGGMGTVYLATHERLARKAALKVVASELSHDEGFRERFLVESRLAASLDHPNVIPIYDAGEVDRVLYLAMRYVPGPSLQARIAAGGPFSPEHVVSVAEQIGGALDAAHRAGLVHRDVKPANILVAEPGDHLYLCYFGLAKRTSAKGVTHTGSFFGTVDYAAPEQIEGRPVDRRVDVYALGCVLYHCLAGSPPYVRQSDFAVLQAHLADPPPRLSSVRAGLPVELDEVVAAALAKDPDDRYATAGGLVDALRSALSGQGASAGSEVTREAPVPAPPRTTEPTARDTGATEVPATTRKRRLTGAPRWLVALALLAAVGVGIAALVLVTKGPSGGSGTGGSADLKTFVDRIENVLEQSAGGRREISTALAAGLDCSITPRVAGQRIASVTENRQSILDQLGTTQASTKQSAAVVTLLQRALQQSIEADRHYRDGFFNTPRPGCPIPPNPDFVLAGKSDVAATAAKERFVVAFNRLARRLDRRTWLASEI